MNAGFPIYTSQNECQDCYKCVRHCTVKAIKIESGHAAVIPDLCISCGHCVRICPAKAKHIRNDLPRVRAMIAAGGQVCLSLAPSAVVEFADWPTASLLRALHGIGFSAVSETALGAEMVNTALAARLSRSDAPRLTISTACPAVVEYIHKYIPALTPYLADMPSPLLAHAGLLRSALPPGARIVFAGPCAAKKREADSHPDLLDAAITFADLRLLLQEGGFEHSPASGPGADDRFFPHGAREGRLYPVPHGMIGSLEHLPGLDNVECLSLSGISELEETLRNCTPDRLSKPVFIEALACPGGCINGPGCVQSSAGLAGRMQVMNQVGRNEPASPAPAPEAFLPVTAQAVSSQGHTERQLVEALGRVGKRHTADELNCGGCGYNTCREFAGALLDGRAEPNMCLSWLRRQAQKKANALLNCMPCGVVIAGAEGTVIECNGHFAHMFGHDAESVFEVVPGLEGARLDRLVPFSELFRAVLRTGNELHKDTLQVEDKVLNVTIFTIEPHQVVGGIILDVTQAETHREEISRRAEEVIRKNLTTVQEIAALLGENMAETEILLRRLADDYAIHPETPDSSGQPEFEPANWRKPG